jgi:hypothetical protein
MTVGGGGPGGPGGGGGSLVGDGGCNKLEPAIGAWSASVVVGRRPWSAAAAPPYDAPSNTRGKSASALEQ